MLVHQRVAGCKRSLFMAQEKATFCYMCSCFTLNLQVSIESLDRKLHKAGVYPMYIPYCTVYNMLSSHLSNP